MLQSFIVFFLILALLHGLQLPHGLSIHQFAVHTGMTSIENQTKCTLLGDALGNDNQGCMDIKLRIDLLVLLKSKLESCSGLLSQAFNSGSSRVQKSTNRLHVPLRGLKELNNPDQEPGVVNNFDTLQLDLYS